MPKPKRNLFHYPRPSSVPMQGYTLKQNAFPNSKLEFCTTTASKKFNVAIQFLGARGQTIDYLTDIKGVEQPIPPRAWQNGCDWKTTFQWKVPKQARTGFYAAECVDTEGSKCHILFTVAPPPKTNKRIAVLASTNTYNAYNGWGGRSAYSTPCPKFLSLHRPQNSTNPLGHGRSHLVRAELWVIDWLESAGYGVDVYSDLDLHTNVNWTDRYAALIVNTHGEYWSEPMRDNLDTYLNNGGNLLYLSGNGLYWKVSYDKDLTTMEVRKDNRNHYQNGEPGGMWRTVRRPEHAVLGVGYIKPGYMTYAPYQVEIPRHWIFKGTGLKKGDLIGRSGINGGAASGWEMDQMNDSSPKNTQLLARGLNAEDYMPAGKIAHFPDPAYKWNGKGGAHMTYYDHPGGGGVFSVGSIAFGGSLVIDTQLQQIVKNVLDRFLR